MKSMPNFTPVQLPDTPDDPEYWAAMHAFRAWAGPHAYLGAAGVSVPASNGFLHLTKSLVDRIGELGLELYATHGSTLSYTATIPAGGARLPVGTETLRMHMRVDPGESVWITGMEVINFRSSSLEWRFRLTPGACNLAVAALFDQNGVEHDIDAETLAYSLAWAPI